MEFPKLKSQFILAPLEEVSGLPFRLLCRKYGASLAYTEMVSSYGIARNNQSTLKLITTCPQDKPVGIQFCGQTSEVLIKAAKKVYKEYDLIDINMGCPSPNIIKQGAGSALLKRRNKIKEIIATLASEIPKPITAKIRSGYSKNEAIGLAKTLESAGASALTMHARLAIHKSSVKANWDSIKQVKNSVSIPVIGNGDVFTAEDANKLLKNCDYVMIARGAMQNPQIFRESIELHDTGKYKAATEEERINNFFQYYKLHQKHPYGTVKILRHRACDFTHGLKNSAKLRAEITQAKTEEQLLKIMKDYKKLI